MAILSLKALRRRVRTVRDTGKITRAMEMVSASKLRRAQTTLLAGRPYAAKLRQLLANLLLDPTVAAHPLFQGREQREKLLVLFTSDRGLCGSFNTNLIKMAEYTLESEPDADWRLICVGRKGRDYFARRRWTVIDSFIGGSGQPDPALARRIAERLAQEFLAGRVGQVKLAYSSFVSTVVYRPMVTQYLPLTPESFADLAKKPGPRDHRVIEYIMDPSPVGVMTSLLPRFLASRIYITMAENATSEHSARMVAMNNATKNCEEMVDQLSLQLNKARQATITRELMDILGGAEALKE